jgi:hypothetical protein
VRRALVGLFAAVASLAVGVAVASANTYLTTGPTDASGASPFQPGCGGPGEAFHTDSEIAPLNSPSTEVEPWFEVNPQNPQDLVGFWQQDRWNDGGSHGLVAGVSHNGGTSWSTTWPAFSNCAGGTSANGGGYERASDPWLSWSPRGPNGTFGTLHAISLSFDRSTAHNAVLASRSLDGGATWRATKTLREDNSNSGPLANLFNDKESITADPVDTNNVYAVWDRIESPNNNPLTPPQAYAHALAFRGPAWFARSIDNGKHWDEARKIFAPQASRTQTIANQIVVLPNGNLVDGFAYITGSNGQGISAGDNAAVIFSGDQGTTWSSNATIIANMGDRGVRDPEPVACLGDNTPATPCLLVRTGDIAPDFAVDYSNTSTKGYVYAVWQTHRSATVLGNPVDDTILLSRSTDGGHQWSAPVKVNQTPSGYNEQAFTASVHVSSNGDVAVTYYDFRNDAPNDDPLSTDYWVVHCHATTSDCSQASGWPAANENRLTPTSFDMRSAPYASGYFTGDYEGLDNFGTTFTPFFVESTLAGTPANPLTDAFYSTAGP